jgi:CDP-diacylglycerol--glycerol-3-phosphate 3-phosphatidyltransferase
VALQAPAAVLNVPNVLSSLRIVLAPVVALAVLGHPEGSLLAAALFAAGAVTDALDGHLARSRGLVTSVGKLLDTTADKLLVIAALASLVAVDRVALWVVAVIAGREVLVTVLRGHALRRGVVLAAVTAGKAKMCLQVVMVLVLMAVADPAATWVRLLVAATVALTLVSGVACVTAYRRERRAVPA